MQEKLEVTKTELVYSTNFHPSHVRKLVVELTKPGLVGMEIAFDETPENIEKYRLGSFHEVRLGDL